MEIIHTAAALNRLLEPKRATNAIGFVPTMGNIHDGHLALVDAAHKYADYVVVSIFVNPTQFSANEDYSSYPRTQNNDIAALQAAGVDCLFMPDREVIYPSDFIPMVIDMPGLTDVFCGATRPHFFSGVCQVVLILCNLVKPNRLYLGAKDWQQWLVLRTLFSQLRIATSVVRVPIVRDDDGLALSSRNGYLSVSERSVAPLLQKTLQKTTQDIIKGKDKSAAVADAKVSLERAGFVIDYFALVHPNLLTKIKTDDVCEDGLLITAVYLGTTRLLDNFAFATQKVDGSL